MNRRSFVSTAALLSAAAAVPSIANAQTPAAGADQPSVTVVKITQGYAVQMNPDGNKNDVSLRMSDSRGNLFTILRLRSDPKIADGEAFRQIERVFQMLQFQIEMVANFYGVVALS